LRYASALYDLASAGNALDAVATDLDKLQRAIVESVDLQRLIASPVLSRDAQGKALAAVGGALGLGELVCRFIGLVARNRRLFALPGMIRAYRKLLADARGEITAEVTAARPLSQAQQAALVAAMKRALGGKVAVDIKLDPALLGGLVVKLGSRMIDNSLKTKLQKLQFAMKGVG